VGLKGKGRQKMKQTKGGMIFDEFKEWLGCVIGLSVGLSLEQS
jgi:hypothetical protein